MSASNLFSVVGKNVLVTGSSRGIGLMIATGFASEGANVLITSRDENACREAIESIQAKLSSSNNNTNGISPQVGYITSNLGTRKGCVELAEYTKKLFNGRLDVLVNNAGTSWGEDPYDRESGRANWGWDKVMDLNVKGIFYLSRECVPLLQQSSRIYSDGSCDPGRIINIGSIAGIITQEAPTHAYDVSKAAVHHLTKKMAADLASKQITVNAIAPGYVPSRMSQGLEAYVGDSNKISQSIPLQRMGNGDDMAGAAIYLSSKAGSWTTGSILVVDGGACTIQMPLASL